MSDSVQPHRRQPTRLPRPWDSPGKNTGVCCRFLLQCIKVKSESEVAQSCPTPSDPMDCSLPGSSVHWIFQARVLEWGAIAFSELALCSHLNVKQLGDNSCFCSLLYTLIVVSLSDQGPQELATDWSSLVSYPILIPLLLSGFRISLGLFLFNQFLLEYG